MWLMDSGPESWPREGGKEGAGWDGHVMGGFWGRCGGLAEED